MLNLAVNARDAMPHGGQLRFVTRTVHVGEDRARHYPDSIPGRYVRLTVSDSGVGIPRDVQPRIFEPFFTTKGQGKGTGLGLATVYGIVRQSGGFLDFASDEGHGTSFDIFIPAAEQAVERATSPEPDALVPRGTETILLAEDDGAVRRLAQQVLTQHGYTVLAARDGDEALVMAARHRSPLDLLITDLVMPGTSGRDLAIRLVANRPTLRILYISGYADQTALPAHGDVRAPLLSKPFPPIELLRKVREVLDGLHTD